MKWIIALCLFTVLHTYGMAQIRMNINISAPFDTIHTTRYKAKSFSSTTDEQVVLKMNYGDYMISNPEAAKNLHRGVVKRVQLVYTQFPEDANFIELNKKRLAYLYILAPEAFQSPVTQWELIMQKGAKSETAAAGMFHGFVIDYSPAPSFESAAREKTYFKNILSRKEKLTDSTVIKVMERNKKNWKNTVVVTDFTGSMFPYVGQVVLWHSLNLMDKSKMINGFVFFNDGNLKSDDEKRAMATGGIYKCTAANLDSVVNTAEKTISNGFGGDAPENDVEALAFAQREFPTADEYILIADNWANMRDYAFIKHLKKPVRVILCGASAAINLQYLDLAYSTKGSIHTIENDTYDLAKLAEGQIIKVGNQKFKFSKNKFQLVS